MHPEHERPAAGLRTGAFLAALVLLFGAGYLVYVHVGGPLLFRLHASRVPALLLMALALVGGAASFFSPCSIAVTPSFLMYFVGTPGDRRRNVASGSLLVALGIVSFYAAAGLLVGWLGALVYNVLVYLIPVIGLLFFVLAYLILSGKGHALMGLQRLNPARQAYEGMLDDPSPKRPRALFGFGAAYGAASHTCTLPIFLGIVLVPLASGNYVLAGLSTLLYGLALAGLLVVMASLGQNVLLTVRRNWGGHLQVATGALFVLTGLYLVAYFMQNYGAFV